MVSSSSLSMPSFPYPIPNFLGYIFESWDIEEISAGRTYFEASAARPFAVTCDAVDCSFIDMTTAHHAVFPSTQSHTLYLA
jgi:hypothetical protein